MRIPGFTTAVMAIGLLYCLTAMADAATYYVSPSGSDRNPGTRSRPFASLERARLAVRAAVGSGSVRVFLDQGVYYLPSTVVLFDDDSGDAKRPVVYSALPGKKVIISGGSRLDHLHWRPYRNGIMMAQLPQGTTTDQLFVNGERQILARYPNYNPNERIYNGYAGDAISLERSARWKDPSGGYLHAMHQSMWGGFEYRITGKDAAGQIQYEGGWQNNRPAPMHAQYRYVEGIFEELDAPREWYLNSHTSTLYYYPPAGVDLNRAVIEIVKLKHLIELRGGSRKVHNITFQGLTFTHTLRTFMETREPLVRSDWTIYRGGAILFHNAEDCTLENCSLDQVGGNAIFADGYNRRLVVRQCHIDRAGANGIAFVGSRDAARVPRDWNDTSQSMANLDLSPGPKSDAYPADCLVENCLIHQTGQVEKQTAPIQIELASSITVRHCSLYDVPRAGINIGDGCWGGHVVEFCDVFDTVKETGDHGSFNSWGRDRFWDLKGLNLNDDRKWPAQRGIPVLDAVKTVTLRNNRWRCDHGWDIDLDDGSTNYHIENNLCLNGGIKNREGFFRTVENNIIVNSGFHPHVWFKHSEDIVRHNIFFEDHYLPAGGMPSTPWGKEMDYNLVHKPGAKSESPASGLRAQSGRDVNSIEADALFVDPEHGDYRVKPDSPALKLGFKNFEMDRFGVETPWLRAMALTPVLPGKASAKLARSPKPAVADHFLGATIRNISGLGERSAYGLPDETGVLVVQASEGSAANELGLRAEDVIVRQSGKPVLTTKDLDRAPSKVPVSSPTPSLTVYRNGKLLKLTRLNDTAIDVEAAPAGSFVRLLINSRESRKYRVVANTDVLNDPLSTLIDGRLSPGYGPVFSNGVHSGAYKLDLGKAISVQAMTAFSYNMGGNRGRQEYILYGSNAEFDPGWPNTNRGSFSTIAVVSTEPVTGEIYVGTRAYRTDRKPLGTFRWIVWSVTPATEIAGGENTAYQELQIVASHD